MVPMARGPEKKRAAPASLFGDLPEAVRGAAGQEEGPAAGPQSAARQAWHAVAGRGVAPGARGRGGPAASLVPTALRKGRGAGESRAARAGAEARRAGPARRRPESPPRDATPRGKPAPRTARPGLSLTVPAEGDYDPVQPSNFARARQARRGEALQLLRAAAPRREKREADLCISGEEAHRRRARLSHGGSGEGEGQEAGPSGGGGGATPPKSVAARIMQKMGWREGEGLGKHGQGMLTPLRASKTGRLAAVVVPAPPPIAALRQGGSPVVLLENMVSPGEGVDGALEDEVAEECTKLYGHVVRVKIFEPADRAVPPRVFVEFEGPAAAARAVVGLGGRLFGGRAVRAKFFDFSRYQRNELAILRPREPG